MVIALVDPSEVSQALHPGCLTTPKHRIKQKGRGLTTTYDTLGLARWLYTLVIIAMALRCTSIDG